MALVKNESGRKVKETFYGLGTFEIEPEQVKEIPDAAWRAWQRPCFWGDGRCPLKEVTEAETATTDTAPENPGGSEGSDNAGDSEGQSDGGDGETGTGGRAEKVYTCPICREEFTNLAKYGGHMSAHRRENK